MNKLFNGQSLGSILHDQNVAGFFMEGDTLYLNSEWYNDDTQEFVPYPVRFYQVSDFRADDVPVPDFVGIDFEGEVIHYKKENNSVFLLLQWSDYRAKKHWMVSYKFNCMRVVADGKLVEPA